MTLAQGERVPGGGGFIFTTQCLVLCSRSVAVNVPVSFSRVVLICVTSFFFYCFFFVFKYKYMFVNSNVWNVFCLDFVCVKWRSSLGCYRWVFGTFSVGEVGKPGGRVSQNVVRDGFKLVNTNYLTWTHFQKRITIKMFTGIFLKKRCKERVEASVYWFIT